MSSAEHARLLIAYNRWANEKVLDMADALTDAQLDREYGASFGSIRGNLQHVLTAQGVWLARWNGEPTSYDLAAPANLRAAYDSSHKDLAAFAEALTDSDWTRAVDYTDSAGAPRRRKLGGLIAHMVNHGTHHRGETGMLLAQLGRSPGDMDLVYFEQEADER